MTDTWNTGDELKITNLDVTIPQTTIRGIALNDSDGQDPSQVIVQITPFGSMWTTSFLASEWSVKVITPIALNVVSKLLPGSLFTLNDTPMVRVLGGYLNPALPIPTVVPLNLLSKGDIAEVVNRADAL